MKAKKIVKLLALICLSISTVPALASKVHIKNENNKDLTVYIQAEGSITEDLHWMELVIPAQGKHDLTVTDKDMGGKATFYVQGKTNPVTPRGKCSNMSTGKNYTITFKNLNIGTECVCEMAKN